jgi:2-iminobutanoate/2-iminopropanoate deaminase
MVNRRVISTDNAPQAIGPYSQAVVADASRLVFCSGQISIDPTTGTFTQGDIRQQTQQVLRNLNAVLEAAGSSLAKVVKITIYIKDLKDYADLNEAYTGFFGVDPPARAVIEAARLPKDALLEMDAIAVV